MASPWTCMAVDMAVVDTGEGTVEGTEGVATTDTTELKTTFC